jgi:hypothetical protein
VKGQTAVLAQLEPKPREEMRGTLPIAVSRSGP